MYLASTSLGSLTVRFWWIVQCTLFECRCRKGLLFWDTARDGYFTRQKDGFDFRLTYSYKELMYEDSDVGAMDGEWPEIKSGQPTGKNLYQAFKEGLPDMWIGNAGAHAFHLRPGMGLSAPDDAAVLDYARNLSRYTQLMQTRYLGRSAPPTPLCLPFSSLCPQSCSPHILPLPMFLSLFLSPCTCKVQAGNR